MGFVGSHTQIDSITLVTISPPVVPVCSVHLVSWKDWFQGFFQSLIDV